jgi:hypothetical protein
MGNPKMDGADDMDQSNPDQVEDDAPASGSDDSESEDEEPEKFEKRMDWYRPENARKFLGLSWIRFGLIFGIHYLVQFGLALCCANFYNDAGSRVSCPGAVVEPEVVLDNGTLQGGPASVYDSALIVLGIYHIIEWVRTIVLIALTCMGGVPLLWFWDASFVLNTLFGVCAYIYAIAARFGANGVACAEVQPERA